MNELKKEIENAYMLLSLLPFSGAAVDVAAACRMSLRLAMALAEQKKPEQEKEA